MNTSWLCILKISAGYDRQDKRAVKGPDRARQGRQSTPRKGTGLDIPGLRQICPLPKESVGWPSPSGTPGPSLIKKANRLRPKGWLLNQHTKDLLTPGYGPARGTRFERNARCGSNCLMPFGTPRGSALMVCLLVMAILMTLGTGLLVNSGLFLKTHGLRKMSRLASFAVENGIKQAWNRVEARAAAIFSEPEISEELFQTLQQAPESTGLEIIRPLLEAGTTGQEEDFSGLGWETFASAGLTELYSDENYLKATFGFNIKSSGRVRGFSGARVEELRCELVLLAGHLPLDQVPAAVNADGIQKEDLHKIKVKNLQPGATVASGLKTLTRKFIPDDALPLLARGLKILKPDSLPNWLLRRVLGLEPGNDPIPDGVYLVQDSLGPGGIYVQGDLDQLLLGIDNGFQVIQFQQGESLWLLRFNPSTATTSFISPAERRDFNELPVPVIMINGQVLELAAGRPDGSGFLKKVNEENTPAFLSGLKLTIACSGKISLTSNLFSDGLDWKEGLPYLRSKQSELIIWSTGKDFQSEEIVEAGISILGETDGGAVIEASLMAAGRGFSAKAAGERINLIGSLAATALNPGRNEIDIYNLPPSVQTSLSEPDLQVYSETTLLHLSHIKILEWRPSK